MSGKIFQVNIVISKYAEYINELHSNKLNVTEFKGKDLNVSYLLNDIVAFMYQQVVLLLV